MAVVEAAVAAVTGMGDKDSIQWQWWGGPLMVAEEFGSI